DVPRDLPDVVAEPNRLQQVLANLLSNARKYSPRGGPIRLSARVSNDQLAITIADSGVGIPPANLDRVFEKFFRVKSPQHREIRGTGLGLAICRQIVEAHGGRIWAESDGIGRGTRVTFTLPIVPKPTARRGASGSGLSSISEHVAKHQRN